MNQLPNESNQFLVDEIAMAIDQVCDPEIPMIGLYSLGLIYEIVLDNQANARITMTLTSPNCPSAQELPQQVQLAAQGVAGVKSSFVELVWLPQWSPHMIKDESIRFMFGVE